MVRNVDRYPVNIAEIIEIPKVEIIDRCVEAASVEYLNDSESVCSLMEQLAAMGCEATQAPPEDPLFFKKGAASGGANAPAVVEEMNATKEPTRRTTLGMETIFRLIEYHRLWAIDDFGSNFFSPVGR